MAPCGHCLVANARIRVEDDANLRFDLFEPGQEDELAQALIAIVTPEDKKHDATLGEDAPDEDEPDDFDGEVTTT